MKKVMIRFFVFILFLSSVFSVPAIACWPSCPGCCVWKGTCEPEHSNCNQNSCQYCDYDCSCKLLCKSGDGDCRECINGGCELFCDAVQLCCDDNCRDAYTERCCDYKTIYNYYTQKCCGDGDGTICDINEFCCDGTCCDPCNCESCVDDECKVCGGDPNKVCCDGTCCNKPCCNSWDCEDCNNGNCEPCLRKASDYEELQQCSNVVSDPSWTPQPNGCSSPFGNNPTGCTHTSFLGACNTHDICYQTCGGTGGWGKYNCDCAFGANMTSVCNALTGEERTSCYDDCVWWKNTYVTAVYLVGDGAWETN
ncbi:MAG: hypothetical protein KAI59_05930, partial [Planctomycetes bacterium]|nr:hypothetical protein [Planctomycetota bacterium]